VIAPIEINIEVTKPKGTAMKKLATKLPIIPKLKRLTPKIVVKAFNTLCPILDLSLTGSPIYSFPRSALSYLSANDLLSSSNKNLFFL